MKKSFRSPCCLRPWKFEGIYRIACKTVFEYLYEQSQQFDGGKAKQQRLFGINLIYDKDQKSKSRVKIYDAFPTS